MPQITSIKTQKRSGRFNIFIDEKFAFGADEKIVADYNLKIGQNLTISEISKIIKKDEVSRLFDASLRFLSTRPRSQNEIESYLSQKIARKESIKFSQAKESPIIDQIIGKLKKYNYIDDIEFTKWWATSRFKKAKGPRLIYSELLKKGIKKETIEQVLQVVPESRDIIYKALEKKLRIWGNLKEQDFKRKIYTYLAQRGYKWETIEEIFAFLKKRR